MKKDTIRKHDLIVVLDDKNELYPDTIVYRVEDIVGITTIGTIEVQPYPICTMKNIHHINGELAFNIRGMAKDDIVFHELLQNYGMVKELFIEKVIKVGSLSDLEMKKLIDHRIVRDTVPFSKVNDGINISRLENPVYVIIVDDDDLERGNDMQRYEIDDMILNRAEATEFLHTYQEFSDRDVKDMYGMSDEDLMYALKLLRKRYDRKNPQENPPRRRVHRNIPF